MSPQYIWFWTWGLTHLFSHGLDQTPYPSLFLEWSRSERLLFWFNHNINYITWYQSGKITQQRMAESNLFSVYMNTDHKLRCLQYKERMVGSWMIRLECSQIYYFEERHSRYTRWRSNRWKDYWAILAISTTFLVRPDEDPIDDLHALFPWIFGDIETLPVNVDKLLTT